MKIHVKNLIFLILCCGLLFFAASYSEAKELKVKIAVLANEPMSKGDWPAYPDVKEIFDSDAKFIVMGYKEMEKEGDHTIQYKIQNASGAIVYSFEEPTKSRKISSGGFLLFFSTEIQLSEDLKVQLSQNNTINIYCDNQFLEAKSLQYTKKNAVNPNIKQIVILPFFSDTNETMNYQSRDMIFNTFSDSLNCEIKRYCAEVIPAFIAEQKTADIKIKDCIKNKKSFERLNSIFGADLYVFGSVCVPKYTDEAFELKVWVINAKTGESKKFQDSAIDESESFIEPKMKKMIFNVLYKKGLIAYLSGF